MTAAPNHSQPRDPALRQFALGYTLGCIIMAAVVFLFCKWLFGAFA